MLRFEQRYILQAVWIAAAVAVLASGVSQWFGVSPELRPVYPSSPVDGTHPFYALQWRFLSNAKGVIPPGSTVTFVSSDPEIDMQLFMLALGVMHDSTPLPWSYWQVRRKTESDRAEYLLAFLRDPPPDENVVEIARFEGQGLVLQRR